LAALNTDKPTNELNEPTLAITMAKLSVNPVPIDISLKFPDSLTIKETSPLKLTCLLSKKPTPAQFSKIKMLKDDQPLNLSTSEPNTRYELIDNKDRQLTFTIEKSILDDSAKYTLCLNETTKPTSCQVKVVALDEKSDGSSSGPKIIQDLKSDYLDNLTTEPFKISLIVEGDDLKVEWSHENQPITPSADQSVEIVKLDQPKLYELALNFASPAVSDSGKYSCRVSNAFASVRSETANVQVKDPDEDDGSLFQTKPRFIEYFSDVYIEPASEARFKCKIIGKPEPKIVWYCNCRKITSNDKFELVKADADHYALVVKNVNFNDEGEYTCKANNCKGETSWSANLYLNESASKKWSAESHPGLTAPNFLRKIKDSTVLEGLSAQLDCYIDGEPFPTIAWFKNNSPIQLDKSGDKYKLDVDADTGKVSFTILNASKTRDEDEYLIRIENSAGVSQCSAYLFVEPSEDDANKNKRKVRFTSPKDTDVFLIPANVKEIPKPPGEPTIHDYKTTSLLLKWEPSPSDANHNELETDGQSSLSYIVEFRSSKSYAWSAFASNILDLSIRVESLIPGLTYSFRVRAENAHGISDPSSAVSTKYLKDDDIKPVQRPEPVSFSSSRRSRGVGEKPLIVGESKDVRYYIEGETAEVILPVIGYPTPIVKWINKSSNQEVKADDGVYKTFRDRLGNEHLEIASASEKDEGLYEITAENEHGSCSHQFYLQQADPPVFLEPFKDVTSENHEDVQLVCKVDGIPYPEVKFYKDWHLLAESYRIRIKHVEPDTWIISIKGAIVRDSGLYTCTAKNIAGGTLSSCNLNVVESLLNLPHPDLKTDLVMFKRRKFEEDYEIVEQITHSSNSKIYRVIERRTAKEFIAKIAYKPDYTEWIKNEADCLNQIQQASNSGFVKLVDAYETPSKMFILIFEEIKVKLNFFFTF
jgi:hypothetical protein